MPKLRITGLAGLFLCLLAPLAAAHPGHGTTEPWSLLHYLSEPVHVLFAFVLLAVVVSIAVFFKGRRESTR
jgi:hypothetical protein